MEKQEDAVTYSKFCHVYLYDHNVSSLQLIPLNMIAYRTKYGSADPAAIVGPAILATAVSTAVAVVFCKIMDRSRR